MNKEIKYYLISGDIAEDGMVHGKHYTFLSLENAAKELINLLNTIHYTCSVADMLNDIQLSFKHKNGKLNYKINKNWAEFKIEEKTIQFDDTNWESLIMSGKTEQTAT